MSEQITTSADAAKRRDDSAISPLPMGSASIPSTPVTRAVDILSFLFLIFFQCGAVVTIAIYTPEIGEMGFVVFGIIFVWLGATLIVGVSDLFAKASR